MADEPGREFTRAASQGASSKWWAESRACQESTGCGPGIIGSRSASLALLSSRSRRSVARWTRRCCLSSCFCLRTRSLWRFSILSVSQVGLNSRSLKSKVRRVRFNAGHYCYLVDTEATRVLSSRSPTIAAARTPAGAPDTIASTEV